MRAAHDIDPVQPAASAQQPVRADQEVASRFATCCRALGLAVDGRRRHADLAAARSALAALARTAPEQCDVWVGLAAAGDTSPEVFENAWRTARTLGVLQRAAGLDPGALRFPYDTGLYLEFVAQDSDDLRLAHAASLLRSALAGEQGHFAQAAALLEEAGSRGQTGVSVPDLPTRWLKAVMCHHAERWSDVALLLTPLVSDSSRADQTVDPAIGHASRVTLAVALARLGMFAPALSHLHDPAGPVPVATVDGEYVKALVLRALDEPEEAAAVLQKLYARHPEDPRAAQALADPSIGLVTTTAERIEARTDPWDPDTEPGAAEFVDPSAKKRKAGLLDEAERQLAEFIGLDEVKDQVSRLKSGVSMALKRQERGLAVAGRTNHLVFAGPPGTGKTTIARVIAKIYCGLGLLRKEHIREVHRADLVGQHIGETEAKTNAVIDSALDGVLFLDEAYTLVSTGAKNDFGLVAVDTLLARMENDRDRLVVVIAGYHAELQQFLDTNEGLRSRFTRAIKFPSYSPQELVEMAVRLGQPRDTVFDEAALRELHAVLDALCATAVPDSSGADRRGIDVAGNGRFVRNLLERSEEEREHRLDQSDLAEIGDEDLMTATAEDVRAAASVLLRSMGLEAGA